MLAQDGLRPVDRPIARPTVCPGCLDPVCPLLRRPSPGHPRSTVAAVALPALAGGGNQRIPPQTIAGVDPVSAASPDAPVPQRNKGEETCCIDSWASSRRACWQALPRDHPGYTRRDIPPSRSGCSSATPLEARQTPASVPWPRCSRPCSASPACVRDRAHSTRRSTHRQNAWRIPVPSCPVTFTAARTRRIDLGVREPSREARGIAAVHR